MEKSEQAYGGVGNPIAHREFLSVWCTERLAGQTPGHVLGSDLCRPISRDREGLARGGPTLLQG
eukprot:4474857-Pyramimonas_sp.AAC.1